ncbi:MAG: chorismate synthase [bacterium]
MIRFLTAGESHGKGLITIIDNFPSGLKIDEDFINYKLKLRQSGYGRGARQKIETDVIEFYSGLRGGYTTGSPISFIIKNKDYENWKERMNFFNPTEEKNKIHIPRPGHADFTGSLKYNLDDIRNVLERSSARETASRVAAGAIFELFLLNFNIEFSSAVTRIGEFDIYSEKFNMTNGSSNNNSDNNNNDDNNKFYKSESDKYENKYESNDINTEVDKRTFNEGNILKYGAKNINTEVGKVLNNNNPIYESNEYLNYYNNIDFELNLFNEEILENIKKSELRMPFPIIEKEVKNYIDAIKSNADTIGGLFEIQAKGVPAGLGSYTQWDEKLDAHIAMSCMSVQAVKSVEIGAGIGASAAKGSEFQDSIYYDEKNKKYFRKTNNAGGIEGGMSNGEIIRVRCAMKPIPTLMKPYLDTVNLETKKTEKAFLERSDVCAVPAASIVGEAAVSYSMIYFFLKKFGGDGMQEIERNYKGYIKQIS